MRSLMKFILRDRLNFSYYLQTCDGEMSLEFSTGRTVFEGKEFNVALMELENAVLLLLWEGVRPLLGTLTATLPGRISSQLLGDRDALLGQVLGEHLASLFQRIALVSVHIKTVRGEAVGRKVLELTKKIVEERDKSRIKSSRGVEI